MIYLIIYTKKYEKFSEEIQRSIEYDITVMSNEPQTKWKIAIKKPFPKVLRT